MIAGGMLGVGALGIFGALSWLLNAKEGPERRLSRLTSGIAFVVGVVVVTHMWVTTKDFIRDTSSVTNYPGWLAGVVDTVSALAVAGLLVFAYIRRRRTLPAQRVYWAGYATVSYALASAVTSGFLLGPAESDWKDVSAWLMVLAVLLPLTIVAVTVGTHILAIAHPSDPEAHKLPPPIRSSAAARVRKVKVATNRALENRAKGALCQESPDADDRQVAVRISFSIRLRRGRSDKSS
jgi:MFS family permease